MNSHQMFLKPIGQGSGLKSSPLIMENPPPGTGASLRQRLLPAGPNISSLSLPPVGNAGVVLEHLKRLSDRMTEENESTRQDVTTYREKLTEMQAALSRMERELANERQENVVLRAKAKDDEAQVKYVIEKMKVVTAIQDIIRNSIDGTKHDIGRVDQYRRDLDVKMLGQDRDVGDVQMALHAVTAARDQLAADLRRAQGLVLDMQSQLRQAAEESARKDAALERLAADVAAKERAAEARASSLQASLSAAMADVAASRTHAEQLRLDLDAERSHSAKAAAQLAERYQEAQQRIMELDRQLCTAHNEQKTAREQILKLESHAQELTTAASGLREEVAGLQGTLADRTSELKNAIAEAEQLGHSLEVVQAELAGRDADFQRLMREGGEAARRAEELIAQEVALREELSARVAEIARTEEDLSAERERAKLKEDELSNALATAQATAAAETARAGAAITAAEQRLREAERAGEARLERFKERTSREYDEMRKRVRAEAEAEAKRLTEELKKATAAVQAAGSLAAQGAAEREEALRAELKVLRTSKLDEIAALKEQMADANRKAREQAQEIKAQYERDLAAARTAAQEEKRALLAQLDAEHQKERDEWDKEMEAVAAAERADAEARGRQSVESLRAELEAKAEASLSKAEAEADKRRHELEAELDALAARLQELENGSTAAGQALAFAHESAAQLELQLAAARRDAATARLEVDSELKLLHSQIVQQRLSFEQRELEWQTQQRRLELERVQSDRDWAAKEEQLHRQVEKLGDEVREAQQEREQERERHQQRECEWLQTQELERKRWQDAAEEQRREFERHLRDLKRQQEQQQRQQQESKGETAGRPGVANGAADGEEGRDAVGDCGIEVADAEGDKACDGIEADTEGGPKADSDEGIGQPPAAGSERHGEVLEPELLRDEDGDEDEVPTSQVPKPASQRQRARQPNKDKPKAAKEADLKPISCKPRGKTTYDSARGASASGALPDAQAEQVVDGDLKLRPPSKADPTAADPGKPTSVTGKDVGRGSVPKPSTVAPRGKAKADVAPTPSAAAALVASGQTSAAAKSKVKGRGGAAANDNGNTENAEKSNAGKAVAPSTREPLAPQVRANNATVLSAPNAKAKDTDAMPPPPPPTAKAQKAVAPPPRFPAKQDTTTTFTEATRTAGTAAEHKAGSKRPRHDEFADLSTESEMDGPSQGQDVTVTGRGNRRLKGGAEMATAAPSQMPATTKGGRFSLFKGMSLGVSVQTNTADAGGGGNEVSSAFGGGGARKKGASNTSYKHRKAAEAAADGKGVMDLFAGMSPYPKK